MPVTNKTSVLRQIAPLWHQLRWRDVSSEMHIGEWTVFCRRIERPTGHGKCSSIWFACRGDECHEGAQGYIASVVAGAAVKDGRAGARLVLRERQSGHGA